MENKKSYVLPIAVMFLLFFSIAFVTNFAGSMGVIVKNQFNSSNALAQLGTLANFIAYACMGIPAGLVLKRKGYKFTSLLAVTVGFVGVGIQFLSGAVQSFGVYVCGALVAGFAMCLLNIVVNPMLNTLGGGGNKGNQLIQWGGTINSIGGTLAPILLGYLIGGEVAKAQVSDAAPAMVIAMGIFVVAFFVILFTRIPEPHMETAEERAARKSGQVGKERYSPLSFRHFVLGAVAIFFYVGVEVGTPNTANLYLTDTNGIHAGAEVAGWFIAAYWFLMMCGRFLGGVIGRWVSSRTMLTVASIVAICFILCFILVPESVSFTFRGVQLPVKIVFISLTGLCTSVMWGAVFNLSTEGLGKYTPMASGIFMTLVCGGGIIPFLQNLLADHVGYVYSYIIVVLGFGYILAYALWGSRNVNKDIPVE
ncbi:MAG: MFS transporter [Bacteroidales bacterium]|nr:MFS transporter [Bacteroidales bacterium]